jgi:hypothetical protein
MGLFGPFEYKAKSGQKFWLHKKEKGKAKLFYFSKEREGALNGVPGGYEVVENPVTGLPFLKKKATAGLFSLIKTKGQQKPQTGETTETSNK